MRMKKFSVSLPLLVLSASLFGALVSSGNAVAEDYHYMDSSGNIHSVESINQVPSRYREQVIPPTPVPVYDKKTEALMKRMQREAEAKRIRAQKEKEREELRQRRLKEREAREREKEAKRREKEARREKLSRPSATKVED